MLKVKFKKIGIPEKQLDVIDDKAKIILKPNEVLIKILIFPINPADILLVEGKYGNTQQTNIPLGTECVARVLDTGKRVKNFKINDIVMPLLKNTWVEKKIVDEEKLIKLPNKIDLKQASMLRVNPASAYLMINNYVKIKQNDYILQNAANSALGQYVIQLCKAYGIKTVNLIRRKEPFNHLKEIGATKIILYKDIKRNINFLKNSKIKLFLDAVGGSDVNIIANLLEENSTVINYGLLSNSNIEIHPKNTIFRGVCLKGFWLTQWIAMLKKEEIKNLYSHLAQLILKKKLKANVQEIYYIKDIKKAVKVARLYKRSGKILVTPCIDTLKALNRKNHK